MAKEIERKFLVSGDAWRCLGEGKFYRQGYLPAAEGCTVRIRTIGQGAYLTIKGVSTGITRDEFEYEIPNRDAEAMLDSLCIRPIIEKTRHRITIGSLIWEVDEFEGENRGLIVAEVELESEDQAVELPEWIGLEVSNDPRYRNASLVRNPFCDWDS